MIAFANALPENFDLRLHFEPCTYHIKSSFFYASTVKGEILGIGNFVKGKNPLGSFHFFDQLCVMRSDWCSWGAPFVA